ncbi:GyrI-like domain-containing protein [Psychromonas sp. KJ10-10]|uniref:GyrI-like domain-containing protein n=1 Tax=Psychromonas sp. KJ10-10 TaxID=3391823 RepID=UPI0039B36B8C
MKVVSIEEKQIVGISVRTTNANEMNPETAKIGKAWQKFDREISVNYQAGERVYGVYYDYESDANGEFNVLAGTEKATDSVDKVAVDKVTIQKGKYLVFEGKATSPDDNARVQAVINTWGEIWAYFSNEESVYKRAFTTDFEHYKDQTDIDIYISIV